MHLVFAVVAGLLLAASDHPLHWWWLQFVAFVPFWWGLWTLRRAGRRAWPFGLVFAAAYALLILLSAGPAPPVLVAAGASLLQWAFAATLAARCLDRGAVRGPLAAAAMLTLVEVATWHLVPVFGTGQAFVRPLSGAPMLVAFVAYTGVGGVVFAVAALQALLVSALRGPSRWQPLAVAGVLVAAIAAMDVQRWTRPLGLTEHVAAIGCARGLLKNPDGPRFVERAAQCAAFAYGGLGRCTLLVVPEAILDVEHRDAGLAFVGDLARKFELQLVVGAWQRATHDNRIWFVDADGSLLAEYRKTHLVPFFENYPAGDGTPTVVAFRRTQLGGMICQDDNFTDLARSYGRLGVPLVAVPTNDWPDIREFHLENAVFRALENGYAVVRAASGGISALISPRGEVVQRCDHVSVSQSEEEQARLSGTPLFLRDPDVVHAELPLGDGVPTFYARFGDGPLVLFAGALVLISLRRRRASA